MKNVLCCGVINQSLTLSWGKRTFTLPKRVVNKEKQSDLINKKNLIYNCDVQMYNCRYSIRKKYVNKAAI